LAPPSPGGGTGGSVRGDFPGTAEGKASGVGAWGKLSGGARPGRAGAEFCRCRFSAKRERDSNHRTVAFMRITENEADRI
jgi:hypothetical protein